MSELTKLIKILNDEPISSWGDDYLSHNRGYPWQWGYRVLVSSKSKDSHYWVTVKKDTLMAQYNRPNRVEFDISIDKDMNEYKCKSKSFTETYSTEEPISFWHAVLSVPDNYFLQGKLALTTERIRIPEVGSLLLQTPVQGMEDQTPIAYFFKELTQKYVARKAKEAIEFINKEGKQSSERKRERRLEAKNSMEEEERRFSNVIDSIIGSDK